MGSIYEIATKTLYPLGSIDENVHKTFVAYMNDLLGELMYLEPNKDWVRVANEWFDEECAPMLRPTDMYRAYKEVMIFMPDTIDIIRVEYRTAKAFIRVKEHNTPNCLLVNDYLPVRKLLARMYEVAQ